MVADDGETVDDSRDAPSLKSMTGDSTLRKRALLMGIVVLVLIAASSTTLALVLRTDHGNAVPKWAQPDGYVKFPQDHPALDHPAVVSADYTIISQNVKIEYDDMDLELVYDAKLSETADKYLCFDYDERVVNLTCAKGHLTITWDSVTTATAVAATLPEGAFLTGSGGWGCTRATLGAVNDSSFYNESDAASTIQHRLVEIVSIDGAALLVRVEPVTFADLFEDLTLSLITNPKGVYNATENEEYEEPTEYDESVVYRTFDDMTPSEYDRDAYDDFANDPWYNDTLNAAPEEDPNFDESALDGFDESALEVTAPGSAPNRRSLFLGRARDLGRRVVGATVRNVVRGPRAMRRAGSIARNIASGNFGAQSRSRTIRAWNWRGRDMRSTQGNGLDLRQSSAHVSIGMTFGMSVRRWRLDWADLILRGDARATAHGRFVANARWTHERAFPLISNQGLGAVTFAVGPVPIRVEAQLNLDAYLQLATNGRVDTAAGAAVSTHAQLGVQFRNGHWQSASNRGWTTARRVPSISAQARAMAAFTLVPRVQLTANWLGGPTASFIPYAVADVSATSQACRAQIGFGVDVTVGAVMDLQNPATGRSLGCGGCRRTLATATVFRSPTTATNFNCRRLVG